jgi:hypothetical protein
MSVTLTSSSGVVGSVPAAGRPSPPLGDPGTVRRVDLVEAWTHLGIEPTDDLDAIRAAYLARLRVVHPDRAPLDDSAAANERTIALVAAYRLAVDQVDQVDRVGRVDRGDEVVGREPPEPAGRAPAPPAAVVPIALLEDDTIAVALPPDATYALVVDAAHHLGEVTHIEPSSGLLQVILEFVEAPPCSLLCSLQGRATGVTEVFCTVESLEAAPAPPVDAVARLLLDEMVAAGGR